MLHLTIGNALIGVVEGLLIAWLFKLPKKRCLLLLIPANYFSTWVGGFFGQSWLVVQLPITLNNGWTWFWILVGITYCMTLVLEWPFIAWCFRGDEKWKSKSIKATLISQTASYVVVFGWYWIASGTTLYTQMHVVPLADIPFPPEVRVYFISPVDGNVYEKTSSAELAQKRWELHSLHKGDRLFVRPNSNGNGWDLMALLNGKDQRELKIGMQVVAAPDPRSLITDPPQYQATNMNFGEVAKLGDASKSPWQCWIGFWAVNGLEAENRDTKEKIHFSYETPFGMWYIRNGIQLPSDKVLFQLGWDQIPSPSTHVGQGAAEPLSHRRLARGGAAEGFGQRHVDVGWVPPPIDPLREAAERLPPLHNVRARRASRPG
ncbi:hypothetical protein SAMN05444156_2063 [Verrucomicrobium sp. GAS474]|nr:hypothetical protein SAMN05444156_2063 [Verrucomicrobium sp. GAS474]